MRLLITGGTGLVGWSLIQRVPSDIQISYTYLNQVVPDSDVDSYKVDITNRDRVDEVVSKVNPDIVVHAAAYTDVDGCETNPERASKVNVTGTEYVLSACSNYDAHIVFLSSSFVFSGTKQKYHESSKRNPINEYGRTKAAAEQAIERSPVESSIIRTDQPYGWSQPWQTDTMVEWVLKGIKNPPLKVFDDWFNNPTYLPDLVRLILRISKESATGTYHAVGPDFLSRYQWAKEICHKFGYDNKSVNPVSSSSADIAASRPNANLVNNKLKERFKVNFLGVKDGAEEMRASQSLVEADE